jgi:hypothetical protein
MSDTPTKQVSAGLTEHINRFQRRAQFHFIISYAVMLVVFMLTGFAVYTFLFAQQIDRSRGSVELFHELDIAIRNQELVIKSAEIEVLGLKEEARVGQRTTPEVVNALTFLGEANTKLRLLQEKKRLMLESGYFSEIDTVKSKEEFRTQNTGMLELEATFKAELVAIRDRFRKGEVTRTDVATTEWAVGENVLKREINEQRMRAAPAAAAIKASAANIDTIELIRTSLIRFGGVAVILFLISILIPVYRYNVRLGTFYLARADTLMLCRDSEVANFGEIIKLLTPAYEFDKEPTTPFDSVSTLVKDAVGMAARKV